MNLQEWESGKYPGISLVFPGISLYFPPGWEILINPGILPTLEKSQYKCMVKLPTVSGKCHFYSYCQNPSKNSGRVLMDVKALGQKFRKVVL